MITFFLAASTILQTCDVKDRVSKLTIIINNKANVEDEATAELAANVGHEAASRPFDPWTDQRGGGES
jgi:hypothetical protein